MAGDFVALMTSARPCYTKSERFTARSEAATAATVWPESCDVVDTMSAVTRLEA